MSKRKFSSEEIAIAINRIMTMANLSGFINQPDEGPLLQFNHGEITKTDEGTSFDLEFGGSRFTVTVSPQD